MIRVLVVDDQQLLRRGLRVLLQTNDDIEVAGEAAPAWPWRSTGPCTGEG